MRLQDSLCPPQRVVGPLFCAKRCQPVPERTAQALANLRVMVTNLSTTNPQSLGPRLTAHHYELY
jgi:hypothetical protein